MQEYSLLVASPTGERTTLLYPSEELTSLSEGATPTMQTLLLSRTVS